MKKLLIIRPGVAPTWTSELDDYLYDSEVIRGGYMDLEPGDVWTVATDTMGFHSTTWEIVFKDDDKYDYWHILTTDHDPYDVEVESLRAAAGLFAGLKWNAEHFDLRAVLCRKNGRALIYRTSKGMSKWIQSELKERLASWTGDQYTYNFDIDTLSTYLHGV